MRGERDLRRHASKPFGTVVLALSLVGLHGSLWYFRPQLEGKISPLSQNSVGNIRGSNRKLLGLNISEQRLSTTAHEVGHAAKVRYSACKKLNFRCSFLLDKRFFSGSFSQCRH